MKLKELKEILRKSGVVGAGGAGFPTYGKLSEGIDTVILNCAECEPLLKLHRQLLEEYTYEILTALEEILDAVGAEKGIIALKAHYKNAIKALEAEIGEHKRLSISVLGSVYPAGDELILIKEVTGRTVPPGKLPASVGVMVSNTETVYNVYNAISGRPVTEKFVTVAGEVASPVTLCVPIGTKLSELVKHAGGLTTEDVEYISGGPMMGKIVSDADVVTKTTNALLVLPSDNVAVMNKKRNAKIGLRRAMSVCCQCRSCTELCSRHNLGYGVEPHMVMRVLSNGGRGDVYKLAESLFCSGCGLCEAYSCPQGLSPRSLIAELKAKARENGFKAENPKIYERKDSDLHRVSLDRLRSRLGLNKYDVPAPLEGKIEVKTVKIPLLQHIGAPSVPCVKEGDSVKKGDVIANAPSGALGVDIHASIDGRIESVSQKYIKIVR